MKLMNVRLLAMTAVFCLLLSVQPLAAQFTSDYVYGGASFGYSTLVGKTDEMSVPGLINGGLHVGWEVRRRHFIYRPLLLDFQLFSSRSNTVITIQDQYIKDTRLADAVMHYKMRSPLKETQRFFIPSIGFMFGYSGNNYSHSQRYGAFYFLAGVKLSFKLDIGTSVDLKYATTASYERYIDDYEDMPNHMYTYRESKATEKYGFKVCGMFSGELGWEFNMDHYDKFKVGAFLDLGLTNIMYGTEEASCAPKTDQAERIVVHSYYVSPEMNGQYVVPVMTGVKITYLFNVNIKRNCISEDCRMGYRRRRR